MDAAALPCFDRRSACFAASSPSPTTAGRAPERGGIAARVSWLVGRMAGGGCGADDRKGKVEYWEKLQALAIQVITGPHAEVEP
uniref:Uncharacterized protein n=1 Tax=Oryza nivara TaxID=4536 RepID=A0A0E0FUQ4_ORYNI